jgi:hypothetical protein
MNSLNRLPPQPRSNPPEIQGIWQTQELTGGFAVEYRLSVSRDLTGDEIRGIESCTFNRLRNHWLMDLAPDIAMPRIYEYLQCVVEDYLDRRAYSGPFTRRRETLPMGIGKTYERPALEYSED